MYLICKVASHPTIDYAAEELKKYLRMMMPRCGEIPIAYQPAEKNGFRLGLMKDFELDTSDAEDDQLDDIVFIQADDNGGIIAGSNPGALLIAVYRYLRFCGCRWLFPGIDGESIPMVSSLPVVNYRKKADHRYRGQCNEGAEYQQNMMETIDYTPKIGMNTYMLEFDVPTAYYFNYYLHKENSVREAEPVTNDTILQWKRQCEVEIQKRGLHFHDMGHGWTAEPLGIQSNGSWEKMDKHRVPQESVPFLAQINGERSLFDGVPLNTNICFSNQEVRQIIAKYVADYAEKQNNVDFLHIWLADATNNHCECDECRKKDVSDWYLILLNEIDAILTARKLNTHLVFIVYVDTFWRAKQTKLLNTKRFTMLYAPISRLYTETYHEDADTGKVVPFNLNHNTLPQGMAECLGYLDEWKKVWPGDCFCYEYHFWLHQYYDPSGMYLAQLLYRDITGLKKHGLNGIVEDGSQRSFFPTGFPFYVYGETLFDASVSYETLKEDYFSHAFGEKWREVVAYLESLRDRLDFAYLSGLCSADESKGKYYNPQFAQKAAEVSKITADFAAVIAANKNQSSRAASVSWRLLAEHIPFVNGIAEMVEKKALGDQIGMTASAQKLKKEFSEKEIYLERYYDQYLFWHAFSRFLNA